MSQFQSGDVVYLKSGGPAMTVREIKDSICDVVWFTSKGELVGDPIPASLLTKDDPSKPKSSPPRPRSTL